MRVLLYVKTFVKPHTSNLFREEVRILLNKSAFIKPQNMNLVLNMKQKMYEKFTYCRNVRLHFVSNELIMPIQLMVVLALRHQNNLD